MSFGIFLSREELLAIAALDWIESWFDWGMLWTTPFNGPAWAYFIVGGRR